MAQIDLRRADVYIKDGSTQAGAINQPSTAPANGDTSITVDGFSAAIPTGHSMTIEGSGRVYTVVSTTGGGTPTAITFTPALATADGIPVNDAVVTIGPNVLQVKIGEGNLTFSTKRSMEYVRNKRSIASGFVRTGDDQPMDVKIEAVWEFLSSDTGEPVTFQEAVTQTGAAATWKSAGADSCEPYAVTIEVVYTPPCSGVKGEVIKLEEFRWESLDHDMKNGSISCDGKCKILFPVMSRETTPITP